MNYEAISQFAEARSYALHLATQGHDQEQRDHWYKKAQIYHQAMLREWAELDAPPFKQGNRPPWKGRFNWNGQDYELQTLNGRTARYVKVENYDPDALVYEPETNYERVCREADTLLEIITEIEDIKLAGGDVIAA